MLSSCTVAVGSHPNTPLSMYNFQYVPALVSSSMIGSAEATCAEGIHLKLPSSTDRAYLVPVVLSVMT